MVISFLTERPRRDREDDPINDNSCASDWGQCRGVCHFFHKNNVIPIFCFFFLFKSVKIHIFVHANELVIFDIIIFFFFTCILVTVLQNCLVLTTLWIYFGSSREEFEGASPPVCLLGHRNKIGIDDPWIIIWRDLCQSHRYHRDSSRNEPSCFVPPRECLEKPEESRQ